MPPLLPFPVSGTITLADATTDDKVIVQVINRRTGDSQQTKTNSSGEYIVDIADSTNGYVDGDLLVVRAYKNGQYFQFRETTTTVTGTDLTINLTLRQELPTPPEEIRRRDVNNEEHHPTANAKKVTTVTSDGTEVSTNNTFPVSIHDPVNGRGVDVDPFNRLEVNSLGFIDANIGLGKVFTSNSFVVLANGVDIDLVFRTPDSPTDVILRTGFRSTGEALLEFFEGTTESGGTPETLFNLNRQSATTALTALIVDPTVTVDGTLIGNSKMGESGQGNSSVGGITQTELGTVLKRSTSYMIRIGSLAASNTISWNIELLEGTIMVGI